MYDKKKLLVLNPSIFFLIDSLQEFTIKINFTQKQKSVP